MLSIHHLGHSQSERVLWLCEELGVPYELKRYARDPVTILSPPELQALHPLGAAPVITEGELVLAESAAIVEYILARHGHGRLVVGPEQPGFAEYLYWFHFANGNLQPVMARARLVDVLDLPQDHPVRRDTARRVGRVLGLLEARLAASAFLAGAELTAADIMSVFSLTTMRLFAPLDLSPFPAILAYLGRIGARDAYRRAMAKGDPDLVPMLT